MNDVVLAACRWLENTSWSVAVRESALAYPLLQWIHFAGLSLWLGACLAVDLRLIGIGPRRQTAAELANLFYTWKWIGCGVALVGGFVLFAAYATMYVSNGPFVVKVAVLTPLAVIWHAAVQKGVSGKWAGVVELVLWISVVVAAVGFLLTNVS
jgi:hypothetical protein